MTVELGSTWGRWTVIKHAAPAQRYGESGTRARVLVRCVCGTERPAFVSDLQSGKTRGCRSPACLWRWRHAGEPRQLDGEVRLLTLREVAERLGVGLRTVERWVAHGRLETVRLGRLVRVHAHEVAALSNPARGARQSPPQPVRARHSAGHNLHGVSDGR